MRDLLDPHFTRVDSLVREIETFVPALAPPAVEFRADLAGLLVVAISAMYEACVKDSVVAYAARHGNHFEHFAGQTLGRLNSRIRVNDLKRYAKYCSDDISERFSENLKRRRARINSLLGVDITKSYDQLLDWRHDFAHAAVRNTTIEEAFRVHRHARHVIFAFNDAFTF